MKILAFSELPRKFDLGETTIICGFNDGTIHIIEVDREEERART